MGYPYASLINAAHKAIDNAEVLLSNENTPFNSMYKQYKSLQSLWFRMIEEASEAKSGKLEDVCIELEVTMTKCSEWIQKNSPTKPENKEEKKTDSSDEN